MTVARRDGAARWARRTEWPLIGAGVVFLVALSWLILADDLSPVARILLLTDLVATWLIFVADFAVRLVLSPDRRAFLRANAMDAASLAIPVLRPFRLLAALRTVRGFAAPTGRAVRRRLVVSGVAIAAMVVYLASLCEYAAERAAPGATIVSFPDALWWSCVTIATVGYGDYHPVTLPGRLIAVGLMIAGVAIVGTTSAVIVSALGERVRGRTGAGR